MLQRSISIIYSILSIIACTVTALKCTKLVTIDGAPAMDELILTEGLYVVNTTLPTNSTELVALLEERNGVEFDKESFTDILQPKDIKILCGNPFVVFIKQLQRTKREVKCNKLLKLKNDHTIPDSYIIVPKHGRTERDASDMITSIQTATDDVNSSVTVANIQPFNGNRRGLVMKMNEPALEHICNDPMVDYIEEEQEFTMASVTNMWHLDRIDQTDLPLNHQYSSFNNGSGVDIYILDSGIKYNHSEFDDGRAVYSGFDAIDIQNRENRQGEDCNGHGTNVASLAGGKSYGAAKGATLHSVRVMDCRGRSTSSQVTQGIYHVVRQVQAKQKSSQRTRAIINLSLIGGYSQVMRDAIREAVSSGILVVAAAGNFYTDACRYSPSSFPEVLTVGGTRSNDRLYKTYFSGSNYGSCVDIFAPGQAVISAGIHSTTSYTVTDGTSLSAPIVSGAAAVYWNMLPDSATGTQVKHLLLDTCTKGKISDIPSAFNSVTSNCLLHVTKLPSQKIFHAVKFEAIEGLIKQMEQHGYAVSYMQEYTNSGNTKQFSLIFNHMENKNFSTAVFVTKKDLKVIDKQLNHTAFQMTFIYTVQQLNFSKFVVVYMQQKINHFKARLQVNLIKQQRIHTVKSLLGMTLYSTSVSINQKHGTPLYTSLYDTETNIQSHFFGSVRKHKLFEHISNQTKNGYHLKHLNSFVGDGEEKYSLVFHKQTKPSDSYYVVYDLKHEVQEYFNGLITRGYSVNVVTGMKSPSGDVQYIVAYESIVS